MYTRVLVALDGSPVAEAILPFVEQVAGPLNLEVVLLRVVVLTPEEAIAIAPEFAQDTPAAHEREAAQYLEGIRKRLADRSVRARARVVVGEAADEIVGVAQTEGADLITMTTHGRSGVKRLMYGSVAEAVVRSGRVPVLLFRGTEKGQESSHAQAGG
jgi:nucleotide-binding universal stress UspA family protein